MSHPFVVITNECQWEGSAGTLLKKDAFGGQLEIPWPQFVNTLQRHFLIATKQGTDLYKCPMTITPHAITPCAPPTSPHITNHTHTVSRFGKA